MPRYSSAWVSHVCDCDRNRNGAGSGPDKTCDSCGKVTKTKVKNFITTPPLLVKRWLAC